MSIIKMVAPSLGTSLSTVGIDIPAKGVITTVAMGVRYTDATPATGDTVDVELTFSSSPQFAVHDARASICMISNQVFFTDAARLVLTGPQFCILTPVKIAVEGGERVFLHGITSGSITGSATAYLFIDDRVDDVRPRARRR